MSRGLSALAIANDSAPELAEDRAAVMRGLTAKQKRISPKYFYDERGSELFDRICDLPEYYLTRTELELMDAHLDEVASLVGPQAAVIEFGAGSSLKIRQLLDRLEAPAAYVPVDISVDYLVRQVEDLARDYPDIHVQPVCADFTKPFELPRHPVEPARNLVFFPGSTIGNFTRNDALELLKVMRLEAKEDGALLVGVDLRKDRATVEAAYNDSQGVTAEFNLNVLRRLNRELDADFDLERFRHQAVYDSKEGRIEMRLVSLVEQQVTVAGHTLSFDEDEYIITEYSHKYSIEEFHDMATRAGCSPRECWVDENQHFSLHYLTVNPV